MKKTNHKIRPMPLRAKTLLPIASCLTTLMSIGRFAFGVICANIILTMAALAGGTNCQATATVGWATYYTVASCKSEGTSGVLTASGRRYNESELCCALPEYPPRGKDGKRKWGRSVKITNALTGKSIICRQWDYGPGKKARSRGVIVDLSPAAFKAVGGVKRNGRVRVKVEEVK